jgi:hypothetical protein
MIDYALWKLNPAGYHFTNILFHAFNAALVYIFILLLARSNLLALLASLIFAVHPINTEVVNSISAREDLFVTFFLLSAFILFLKYRGYSGVKKKIAYIVSCVSFLPALLSKETAIMFVPLIFLYDFILSGRRLKDIILDLKSRYLGFIAAALFYLYIYVFVFRPSYGFYSLYAGRTLYSHILTSLKVLAGYVTAFAAPFGIAITPPSYTPLTKTIFDAGMIASLIILVLLIGLAFRVYKYSKAASFGLAWFFIAILPTSNIIRLVNMFSYRYMYFPGIGLCLALAILLLKVAGSAPLKKISPYSQKIAMVLVVGGYMAVTIPQNISWRNDFTVG